MKDIKREKGKVKFVLVATTSQYFLLIFHSYKINIFRSCDGNMLVVSSTDGFCSVIKFMPDEIGTAYSDEEADLEPLMALDDTDADLEPLDDSAIDADDELMLDDIDSDDDMVPVSKDGIPLNKVLLRNLIF